MTRSIVFAPEAREDLIEIGDYIAKDNPPAARDFVEKLILRCNDLAHFPNIGKKRVGCRTLAEGDYIIVYKVRNQNTLDILRVVHGKRDLNRILNS